MKLGKYDIVIDDSRCLGKYTYWIVVFLSAVGLAYLIAEAILFLSALLS